MSSDRDMTPKTARELLENSGGATVGMATLRRLVNDYVRAGAEYSRVVKKRSGSTEQYLRCERAAKIYDALRDAIHDVATDIVVYQEPYAPEWLLELNEAYLIFRDDADEAVNKTEQHAQSATLYFVNAVCARILSGEV